MIYDLCYKIGLKNDKENTTLTWLSNPVMNQTPI